MPESAHVNCPFYHCHEAKMILCEGYGTEKLTCLGYQTKRGKDAHMEKYCMRYWGNCWLAKLHLEKHGVENEDGT